MNEDKFPSTIFDWILVMLLIIGEVYTALHFASKLFNWRF